MIALDRLPSLAPPIPTWPTPAIIRSAGDLLLRPSFWPADRAKRAIALEELVASGRISQDQAERAVIFFAPAFFYAAGATATYLGRTTADTSTSASYSFAGVNIGTGPSYLVLSVLSGATAARTISGLTVAGAAATSHVASASGNNPCAIFGIAVAAGGTASIVVTVGGGNSLGCAVDLWALSGLNSTTPTSTNSAQASNPSASITPLAGGVVIAAALSGANTSCTWTGGVTERSDYTVAASNTFNATAADVSKAAAVAITPQATFGINTTPRILLAAFR